jgi:Family of unknown function (DUF6152)
MRTKFQISLWTTLGVLLALPLSAHHSVSAEFDTTKSFSVQGKLTKIEWVNPHSYIYLESKDDNGAVVNYSFEAGPPGNLRRAGVLRNMLSVGDAVTIDAFAAKDGSKHLGLVKAIHFADGHTIVMGKDAKDLERLNK